jgi:hypothetical protein
MFGPVGYGGRVGFDIVTIFAKWKQQTGNDPFYNQSVDPVLTTLTLEPE